MEPFRVCVFCGSSPGVSEVYRRVAGEFGAALAGRGIPVVYGAGGRGVMGALADGALGGGGEVIGVIPQSLMDREYGRLDLSDLRIVASMHERKALMHELSAAFVVLPGGLGTFEEMFEITTWAQLGLHDKPVVALNVAGYFDPLARLLAHAVDQGFVRDGDHALIGMVEELGELLAAVDGWAAAPARARG